MRRQVAKDLEIATLAAAQDGVVARSQLRALGIGDAAIDHRVRGGRLHVVHRGVYAVGHPLISAEGRWRAAVLAVGDGAVLSHVTAAAAWEWRPLGPRSVHLSVPGDGGREHRSGIVVHRSTTLRREDVATHRGLPVTTPIRTLLDVAATVRGRRLEQLLDRAEPLIDFDSLQQRLEAHPQRRGVPALRALLASYEAGSVVTRSELEEGFLRLCDDHGLPRPVVNAYVEGILVDFVWRRARLVVEVDGYRHHRSRRRFATDREQDVVLRMAGWTVLRFAWEHVTDRAAWVARAVGGCLAG
jgi:hypothetical protein